MRVLRKIDVFDSIKRQGRFNPEAIQKTVRKFYADYIWWWVKVMRRRKRCSRVFEELIK
ncbi:hypothetical protein ES703_27662 [subsurface metagenome]